MQSDYTLVVFSHLRWHFEQQRPQHLLARLAIRHPVIFIEEPVFSSATDFWECAHPAPNVQVCRPHTGLTEPGFGREQTRVLAPLISELLASEGTGDVVAWLYAPGALPLARSLSPRLLVYDCMDEVPEPPDAELMALADVIFADGPTLFERKLSRAPNVYCLPSSVDAAHFHAALIPGLLPEPVDQAWLPHPRLGYYGVIDDRLDLGIIERLAAAHPEWSIVMVGPVATIDPGSLPRRPNILYTGQRTYDEFPGYLAGWDVCLLPFALGEASRFLRPAQTLEYMVAERPIVSTAVAEVAGSYGDIVYLTESAGDFIRACETALASSPAERARRATLMQRVMGRTSWDATAIAMETLIADAISARPSGLTQPRFSADGG